MLLPTVLAVVGLWKTVGAAPTRSAGSDEPRDVAANLHRAGVHERAAGEILPVAHVQGYYDDVEPEEDSTYLYPEPGQSGVDDCEVIIPVVSTVTVDVTVYATPPTRPEETVSESVSTLQTIPVVISSTARVSTPSVFPPESVPSSATSTSTQIRTVNGTTSVIVVSASNTVPYPVTVTSPVRPTASLSQPLFNNSTTVVGGSTSSLGNSSSSASVPFTISVVPFPTPTYLPPFPSSVSSAPFNISTTIALGSTLSVPYATVSVPVSSPTKQITPVLSVTLPSSLPLGNLSTSALVPTSSVTGTVPNVSITIVIPTLTIGTVSLRPVTSPSIPFYNNSTSLVLSPTASTSGATPSAFTTVSVPVVIVTPPVRPTSSPSIGGGSNSTITVVLGSTSSTPSTPNSTATPSSIRSLPIVSTVLISKTSSVPVSKRSTTPTAPATTLVVVNNSTSVRAPTATEPCDKESTLMTFSTAYTLTSTRRATHYDALPSPTDIVIDYSMTPVVTSKLTATPIQSTVPTQTVSLETEEPGLPEEDTTYCGVRGEPAGTYFIAEFIEERSGVPVTLEGCYQFCQSVMEFTDGCQAYRYYENEFSAPRCSLYGMPVPWIVRDLDKNEPDRWYDLDCGSPTEKAWEN